MSDWGGVWVWGRVECEVGVGYALVRSIDPDGVIDQN